MLYNILTSIQCNVTVMRSLLSLRASGRIIECLDLFRLLKCMRFVNKTRLIISSFRLISI